MNYRCVLPEALKTVASQFLEFANGGAQATVELKDGRVFPRALISNSSAIVALRGFDSPPFGSDQIARVYQTEDDANPEERDGWRYWDNWA
ncbi:hypothetical protein FN976_22105 [Caenimonas sedimenti]|uniref:Uncharacterized protein n=1 Tax=Caenimonas sedimenti TaxID=2596921 RepID=A0A562ZK53_9BURK|nr:hypothetical protein [Caenimonas sedimenti]TWO68695.1 hypothetical protein FN976_22105 [Caenimonas sedimenti]